MQLQSQKVGQNRSLITHRNHPGRALVHGLARQLGKRPFFQSGIDPHLAGSSRDNPGGLVAAGDPAPFLTPNP
jgi:hypothetical protein